MHYWMGWGGGGWFMMIFWWAVVIGIVYLVVRSLADRRPHAVSGESALEILKKRYARGEISKSQFEQQRKDIS